MSSSPVEDPEREANLMHAQLRKDVASWSATRTDETTRSTEDFRVPVTQPPVRRATRAKPAQPAAPEANAATTAKKPFSMSYDGVTTREHIAYRISRGAR